MMLEFKRSFAVALACATVLAGAAPASAFSRLGREDGSLPEGDGVVATPLPPLHSPDANPAAAAQNNTGTESPTVETQPAAPQPDDPAPTPDAGGGASTSSGATGSSPPADPMPLGSETQATQPAPTGADTNDAAPGTTDNEAEPDGTDPSASQQAMPKEPSGPPPDVVYGDNQLPEPVRDLRAKLLEIAKSGDIEKLRAFIQPGEEGTVLSFGGIEGDPIEYLKTSSGDGEGVETMAILMEILESGHIRNEPGTENEIYVWPYFAGLPIDKLTKPQKVELFELITAGDYQEMTAFGAYNFYRVGITPDGKLQFFVAGD